jgi:hypothetical protein
MKKILALVVFAFLTISVFGQITPDPDQQENIDKAWELYYRGIPTSDELEEAEDSKVKGVWELFIDGESQGTRRFVGQNGKSDQLRIFIESAPEGAPFTDEYLRYRIIWPTDSPDDFMNIIVKDWSGSMRLWFAYGFRDNGNTMVWVPEVEASIEYVGTEEDIIWKRVQ